MSICKGWHLDKTRLGSGAAESSQDTWMSRRAEGDDREERDGFRHGGEVAPDRADRARSKRGGLGSLLIHDHPGPSSTTSIKEATPCEASARRVLMISTGSSVCCITLVEILTDHLDRSLAVTSICCPQVDHLASQIETMPPPVTILA